MANSGKDGDRGTDNPHRGTDNDRGTDSAHRGTDNDRYRQCTERYRQ